jgi:N-acyl-D-aspartate/D-glutamate deacylase
MFDTIIANGSIVDGTGKTAFSGDVGIRDGVVVEIGALAGAAARNRIDAAGLVVAPGFIDIHTHSDFTLLVDGSADSQVHQGVTLEVVGQCGTSCAPFGDAMTGDQLVGYIAAGIDVTWRSFTEYLERLDQSNLGVKVAAMVGHGNIRRAVKGESTSLPTGDEIRRMTLIAEECFDAGAIGFSTGLEYFPGNIAPQHEIAALCQCCAQRGLLYATHVRNRDVYYDLGFSEAIATARHAGAKLQISHIQPKYGAPSHAMESTLDMLARARREGLDVAYDVIPHDWSHTAVVAALPVWAREGGVPALIARLKDPAQREAMNVNPQPIWRLVAERKWSDVVLLKSRAHADLVGSTFQEIGQRRNCDPFDAALDMLLEEGEGLTEMLWTSHSFSEEDVRLCIEQPECIVMSDTLALSRHSSMQPVIGSLSGFGWTARLLGHYARDEKILTLEDAVRRITSSPADRLGLSGYGRLALGAAADLVVFDPATVTDRSTLKTPKVHPDGFHHVLLDGVFTLRSGARTEYNPGKVVRRTH